MTDKDRGLVFLFIRSTLETDEKPEFKTEFENLWVQLKLSDAYYKHKGFGRLKKSLSLVKQTYSTVLLLRVLIFPMMTCKKGKRKVQGVPQSQTTALPRHKEEEETDKTKQVQIEQTNKKQ